MQRVWSPLTHDTELVEKIATIVGCHEIIAKLLVNRGIKTPEEAYIFLNPTFSDLKDPFDLKDMQKAVERIYTAICNKENIIIFGDFDADGITATVLLNDFLHYVEAEVSWYIPHRIVEGYSLKPQHIEMAVRQKCDLIITVDCGSDSHGAVKAAINEDIDVIITDHHEITESAPEAFAIINPKQKDCQSNLEHLAGVGVAFYLIIALRSYLRQQGFWRDIAEPKLIEYCDLFAIGTIADMVPMRAENRILSKAGISVMQKGNRKGLYSLIKISGINPNNINSDDISFRIAPRINAAGRISHSRICVDLLSEKSSSKAEQTAFILEELNKKRQDIEKWIIDEIEQKISLHPEIVKKSSILMADRKWHSGVLGIVASRLAKKYFRPVILISTASLNSQNSNKSAISQYATGSCRSVETINIYKALSQCSEFLENFGGHSMAAGISIKAENIEAFAELFEKEVKSLINYSESTIASDSKVYEYDCVQKMLFDTTLNIDDITETLVSEIEKLRPFGVDNPEPFFCCYDVKVVSDSMIGSKHRKMVLQQHIKTIDAIQFNIKSTINSDIEINNERKIDIIDSIDSKNLPKKFDQIVFRVKINRFNGKNTLQIVIEDVKESN